MGKLQEQISTLKLEETGCIESAEAAIQALSDAALEKLASDDRPIHINRRVGHKLTHRLREDRKMKVKHPALVFCRRGKYGTFKEETEDDWYDLRVILDSTYDDCIAVEVTPTVLVDDKATEFEVKITVWDGDMVQGYPTDIRGSIRFLASESEFPQYFELLPEAWRGAMRKRVELLAVELTEQHAATKLAESRYRIITEAISQL